MEGVIDAVEIIEDAGDSGDFDDLTFIKVPAEFGKQIVSNIIGVAGELLSEFQGYAFTRAKAT